MLTQQLDDEPQSAPAKKVKTTKVAEAKSANGDATTASKPKKSPLKRAPIDDGEEVSLPAKKVKKTKSTPTTTLTKSSTTTEIEDVAVEELPAEDDVVPLEDDDETAALLKGFESSEDEDDVEEPPTQDEGIAFADIPSANITDATRKQLERASNGEIEGDKPGIIFIGRIPHGFFEPQMLQYFSQFGDIKHLRISRNKKSGKSKHYGFIEFASSEVADIVARTMNKYLMFGHILQVHVIPPEQVPKALFLGMNGVTRRFHVVPRNAMERREMRLPKDREVWQRKIDKENQKRKEKEEKMKALGYDFKAPPVKSIDEVPMRPTFTEQAREKDIEELVDGEDEKAKAIGEKAADEAPEEIKEVLAQSKKKGNGTKAAKMKKAKVVAA